MTTFSQYVAGTEDEGTRLDVFLSSKDDIISRTMAKTLIDSGSAAVNGRQVKPGYRLRAGDTVTVEFKPPSPPTVRPQPIDLDIVYEDGDIVVIDKPKGMVVHPAPGNPEGTLVNALLHHCGDLSGIGGVVRPGIVHRLDKDTTGLLVVAKTDQAHNALVNQIKGRKVKRQYLALVHGTPAHEIAVIDVPIGRHPVDRKRMAVNARSGRQARTHYRLIERFPGYSLLECTLDTGRTHQIRVHLNYIGHPVAGDPVYGPKRQDNSLGLTSQALHAAKLGLIHPRTGEWMEFTSQMPEEMKGAIEQLRRLRRDPAS